MKFGEKLKALRMQHHLTQSALAEKLGVSLRTLQNYETCKIYPKQTEIYGKIAKLFGVSTDYLLGDTVLTEDGTVPPHQEAAHQAQELILQAGSLFSGGNLSEEDMDKVLCAINDLYWDAKRKNQKKSKKD